jgi:hypothetical protein
MPAVGFFEDKYFKQPESNQRAPAKPMLFSPASPGANENR